MGHPKTRGAQRELPHARPVAESQVRRPRAAMAPADQSMEMGGRAKRPSKSRLFTAIMHTESTVTALRRPDGAVLEADLGAPSVLEPATKSARQLEVAGATWWSRVSRVAILASVDAAALVLAGTVAFALWAHGVLHQPASLYYELLPLVVIFLLSFAKGGLYPGFGVGAVETIRQATNRTSFVFVMLASASFVLKLPHHYSRMTFAVTWGLALLTVPLARFAALSFLRRVPWWCEPVILVGDQQFAEPLLRSLSQAVTLGYKPVGRLALQSGCREDNADPLFLGGVFEAPAIAKAGVRVAVILEAAGYEQPPLLQWLQQYFSHVIEVRGYAGAPVYGVSARDLGGVLGLEFRNQLLVRRNMIVKRCFDVCAAGVGLVLSFPLLLLAGLLVKLSSRGPVLFHQEREGRGGARFMLPKVRTMYVGAEGRLADHLAENQDARAEWERSCKLARDPRVIPIVGRLLRRLSLDELPQLWNVLRGQMSLVGPRPFPEYHLARFDPEFRALRRSVRPGLTGFWQTMIRSDGTIQQQEAYDTYYIRNWSLWLDLYILARTAWAVASGRGAR
jgi:Undecaprenyl-phosphate galactose phosphotransferase WbaP